MKIESQISHQASDILIFPSTIVPVRYILPPALASRVCLHHVSLCEHITLWIGRISESCC